MLAYTGFTLLLMLILSSQLVHPQEMLMLRLSFVGLIGVLWALYRLYPSPLMRYLRVALVLSTLSRWYPDTYEFNRLFPNLDHLFASWEQTLFGCQPSLLFSQYFPWKWVSEPLYMGYFSYFPMMLLLVTWVWLRRPQELQRSSFILMASFFLYYVVYIFLPVAGPQYYFAVEGVSASMGIFPAVGHYFAEMRPMYASAGAEGFFHTLIDIAHEAGERPTAAFPSSHIGVSTILLLLSRHCHLKGLMWTLLPFYFLLCAATVYIHAHYLIDAIAGFLSAFIVYFLLSKLWNLLWNSPRHDSF